MENSKPSPTRFSQRRLLPRRIIKFSMHALIQETAKYRDHLRSNNPVPLQIIDRVTMYYIGPAPVLPKDMKVPPHVFLVPASKIYSSGHSRPVPPKPGPENLWTKPSKKIVFKIKKYFSYSKDFTAVILKKAYKKPLPFEFKPAQAKVVKRLFENLLKTEVPWVSKNILLDGIGYSEVEKVFADIDDWKKLVIVHPKRKGLYKLNLPPIHEMH